jgi:hypothetical protein
LPLLLAVWSQFVFEGLEALHADIIIWPMGDDYRICLIVLPVDGCRVIRSSMYLRNF